jgi:broad specificity phosphatase PhoE
MTASVLPPFYFLRHGETDWNRLGICQGQSDIPLNETGILQAEMARDALAGIAITHIVSSDLSRARKTAEIVNQRHSVPLRTMQGLREISFGRLEGQPRPDPRYAVLIEKAAQQGGEPPEQFADRVMDALDTALAGGGLVLIVAHGGVFHVVKSRLGLAETDDLSNAAPVLILPAELRFDVIMGRGAPHAP